MKKCICAAVVLILCTSPVLMAHDANKDVMTINSQIQFPEKEAIGWSYKAMHFGQKTFDRMKAGEVKFAYRVGKLTAPYDLKINGKAVKAGEYNLRMGADSEGEFFVRLEGGETIQIQLKGMTQTQQSDHLTMSFTHADEGDGVIVCIQYGKVMSELNVTF